MRTAVSLVVAAIAATVGAADSFDTPPGMVCNANNCLRAIRNPTRPGKADCGTALRTTVTPSTVTVTDYKTITVPGGPTTVTVPVTGTTNILVTVSTTVVQTITETDVLTVSPVITVEKRAPSGVEASIPAYATPCADIAEYSSACACLGVYPVTVTAAAPSTTVISTVTETKAASSTVTVVTTVATVTNALTITQAGSSTVTVTVTSSTTVSPPTASETWTGVFQWTIVDGPKTYEDLYYLALANGQNGVSNVTMSPASNLFECLASNFGHIRAYDPLQTRPRTVRYDATATDGARLVTWWDGSDDEALPGYVPLACTYSGPNNATDCSKGNGDFKTLVICNLNENSEDWQGGEAYILKEGVDIDAFCAPRNHQLDGYDLWYGSISTELVYEFPIFGTR